MSVKPKKDGWCALYIPETKQITAALWQDGSWWNTDDLVWDEIEAFGRIYHWARMTLPKN
jgi:hypothetical protein